MKFTRYCYSSVLIGSQSVQEEVVNPCHQTLQGQSIANLELTCRISWYESKHYIKGSEGNLFNLIFKGNVQGWKHPGRCAFAEPELLYFRNPKRVLMVALKLTHWTLGYEVEILNFSKLVFTKSWHVLSDNYQAFYTFLCKNVCKSGINIETGTMTWGL